MTEPGWLSITADAASVIGLLVTAIVWYQVENIKRSVARGVRIPETIRDLEKYGSDLREVLKTWPTSERDAAAIVNSADMVLMNVLKKLDGDLRKVVSEPRKLIRRKQMFLWLIRKDENRLDHIWAIHDSLARVIEALRQQQKDYKKRT